VISRDGRVERCELMCTPTSTNEDGLYVPFDRFTLVYPRRYLHQPNYESLQSLSTLHPQASDLIDLSPLDLAPVSELATV